MSKELIEKIDELENQIDNVDQKFTGALDKLSDSMEKVAIALVKLDAQEEVQKNIQSKQEDLTNKFHDVDKRVDLAQQAAQSTDTNTQEIKAVLNKLMWLFVSGFFGMLITGVYVLIKT